ncbi:MAG: glucose-6-phosphate isomerase, partial [Acidobacteriota bacterium]
MTSREAWRRYRRLLCVHDSLGLRLDPSRMRFEEDFLDGAEERIAEALAAMELLEGGAIANPDEDRAVGHYWLRAPELAPDATTGEAIRDSVKAVCDFADRVHAGEIAPRPGERFTDVLVVGIGGSALGPQLVADALGDPATDRMRPWFFDNTDPDGFDRILQWLGDRLASTVVLVISKSGGTAETRNGMLAVEAALKARGLELARHAVAITGAGSRLDRVAEEGGWLARFPMWDWVGGRTSVTSAVGLLPAALQGIDVRSLLAGARDCDAVTRGRDARRNPAALLALTWLHATAGRGEKDMVVLPYK